MDQWQYHATMFRFNMHHVFLKVSWEKQSTAYFSVFARRSDRGYHTWLQIHTKESHQTMPIAVYNGLLHWSPNTWHTNISALQPNTLSRQFGYEHWKGWGNVRVKVCALVCTALLRKMYFQRELYKHTCINDNTFYLYSITSNYNLFVVFYTMSNITYISSFKIH